MAQTKCPRCGKPNPETAAICASCFTVLKTKASMPAYRGWRDWAVSMSTHTWVVAVIVLVLIWAVVMLRLSPQGLAHMVSLGCLLGLLAIGLTITMVAGGIDLSLAGIAALAATVTLAGPDWRVGAILAGLAVAGLVGLANGYAIARKGLPPALTTLAVGGVAAGISLALRQATSGAGESAGHQLAFIFPLACLVVAILASAFLLFKSKLGQVLRSLGKKEEQDISPGQAWAGKMFAYEFAAILAGIAGVLVAMGVRSPSAYLGQAWVLTPLAAVLIGGASIKGRINSLGTALLGTALVTLLSSYLFQTFLPADPALIAAAVLAVGLALEGYKRVSLSETWESLSQSRRRMVLVPAGAAICLIALLIVTSYASQWVPQGSALVSDVQGTVMVRQPDTDQWVLAHRRMRLHRGAAIRTQVRSLALLALSDGSAVKMSSASSLVLQDLETRDEQGTRTRLFLRLGRVWLLVKRAVSRESRFEVETPLAVAGVRGTALSMASEKQLCFLSVWKGKVEFQAEGRAVTVGALQQAKVKEGKPPSAVETISHEEIKLWEIELPTLEEAARTAKLEAAGRAGLLGDDFSGDRLDTSIWMVRRAVEPGVKVRVAEQQMSIAGPASQTRKGLFSYGVLSQDFATRACELSVRVMLPQGRGSQMLRLADGDDDQRAIAVMSNTRTGYWMVASPGELPVTRKFDPFLDERSRFHRLTVRYDPATGIAQGFVDDRPLGQCQLKAGETLRAELLYLTAEKGSAFDARFATFRTDVRLPGSELADLAVGSIDYSGKADPERYAMILAWRPVNEGIKVRQVRVSYPAARGPWGSIFASVGAGAKLRGQGTYWSHRGKLGVRPSQGDYIFRVTLDDGTSMARWQSYLSDRLYPTQKLTDKKQGTKIMVSWEPVANADYYWVDVLDAETQNRLFASQPTKETQCVILPSALKSDREYFVSVKAHSRPPQEKRVEPDVSHWSESCASADAESEPGSRYFLSVHGPEGIDYFSARCGPKRVW